MFIFWRANDLQSSFLPQFILITPPYNTLNCIDPATLRITIITAETANHRVCLCRSYRGISVKLRQFHNQFLEVYARQKYHSSRTVCVCVCVVITDSGASQDQARLDADVFTLHHL